MNVESIAWVDCHFPGCEGGLVVDARHLRNFEGREWTCREHDNEVTC